MIYKNKKNIINYLRKNGCKNYNNASDEYIINEAFFMDYVCQDYYYKTGYYKINKTGV